jgi:hypothetical protein
LPIIKASVDLLSAGVFTIRGYLKYQIINFGTPAMPVHIGTTHEK